MSSFVDPNLPFGYLLRRAAEEPAVFGPPAAVGAFILITWVAVFVGGVARFCDARSLPPFAAASSRSGSAGTGRDPAKMLGLEVALAILLALPIGFVFQVTLGFRLPDLFGFKLESGPVWWARNTFWWWAPSLLAAAFLLGWAGKTTSAAGLGPRSTRLRIRRGLAGAVVVMAAVIAATGWLGAVHSRGVADSASTGSALVLIASMLSLGAALIVRRNLGGLLTIASISLCVCLSLLALQVMGSDLPFTLWRARERVFGVRLIKLWEPDPRLGWVPIAGTREYHANFDYQVRYSIDDEGWRLTRKPPRPMGVVTFSGGSYTFGIGVQDDEAFPAVFAERHWPDLEVRNLSAAGWGTSQAYLCLEDELRREDKPDIFIYGWISHHRYRNYIGNQWVEVVTALVHRGRREGLIPRFEIEEGRLVNKGLWGNPDTPLDPDIAFRRSIKVTLALLRGMDRLCARKGSRFFIARFAVPDGLEDQFIFDDLGSDVEVIDLRGLSEDFFEHDLHPRKTWHETMADAIAADPRIIAAIEDARTGGVTPITD